MNVPNLNGARVRVHPALPLSEVEAKCVAWGEAEEITLMTDENSGLVTAVIVVGYGSNVEVFCTQQIKDKLNER